MPMCVRETIGLGLAAVVSLFLKVRDCSDFVAAFLLWRDLRCICVTHARDAERHVCSPHQTVHAVCSLPLLEGIISITGTVFQKK